MMTVDQRICQLVNYGVEKRLIREDDKVYAINRILEVMELDEYDPDPVILSPLEDILKDLTDDAVRRGIVKDDSIVGRDLFDTKLMGCLVPRPSQVIDVFWNKYRRSPEAATDFYYRFSQDTDYIRTYRVKKDMKCWLAIILAMSLCLPMAACAVNQPVEEEPPVEENTDTPAYNFVTETTSDKYSDEEGNLMASYSYQVIRMKTAENAPEEVVKMAEVLNEGMDALLEECLAMGNELGDWAAYDENIRESGAYYTDELTVSWEIVGSILSISYDRYSFTGGSHSNVDYSSYLFDLERGNFLDPTELADDPELLRATVTDLLLDQIAGEGLEEMYFEGYVSTVSQWNSYCVRLSETEMTVVFSPYVLVWEEPEDGALLPAGGDGGHPQPGPGPGARDG